MAMAGDRRPRFRDLHINRMIPNVLTLLALSAGLTAIRFSLQQRWELAILAILVAGILDGLDGRIARILKGASRFGAELDSLSDFLCFGIAPALTLYLWALTDVTRFGWAMVLLFSICAALRLARFNTALDDDDTPPWTRNFFTGVPSPAGAGLALMPMVLWFQLDLDFLRHPAVVGLFMVTTALLLVSRIRTYSFKRLRIAHAWVPPMMIFIALYLALLFSNLWITLSLTMAAYMASIPFSMRDFQRMQQRQGAGPAPGPDTAA